MLERMTDAGFIRYSRWIITAIGLAYLAQAAQLYFG